MKEDAYYELGILILITVIGMTGLYLIDSCKKVWETYLNHTKQFVSYTDIPSYGLKNNKCKLCKGENDG